MTWNRDAIGSYLGDIFKPGAVLVSYGMRGGGKTHTAVAFCQKLMENYWETTPKHVILITNVIFVRKSKDGQIVQDSPPGVHTVMRMESLFPVIVDALEKHGRKDTLIILLLDEAQNFLLGDDNSKTDMASSMKKFCGIIRKFNLCLWLLSPAMRNLGPAFRNFLDSDNDPGNVNCTFQKNTQRAKHYMNARNMKGDPRSLVFVKTGEFEPTQVIPVPPASWTREPEIIAPGDYAYDHLASADFDIGDFPFREFVRFISGRSSYELIKSVRSFYETMDKPEAKTDPVVKEEIVKEREMEIMQKCLSIGMKSSVIAEILDKHPNTIANWKKKLA